jgi:hypothetical protein
LFKLSLIRQGVFCSFLTARCIHISIFLQAKSISLINNIRFVSITLSGIMTCRSLIFIWYCRRYFWYNLLIIFYVIRNLLLLLLLIWLWLLLHLLLLKISLIRNWLGFINNIFANFNMSNWSLIREVSETVRALNKII